MYLWRNIKLHLVLAILVARHPSTRHFQTALIFLKDQKGVALHQSRGGETSASVRKTKRSCERRSENLCDLTGKRAPRTCIVINVLLVTTISYLIPGTSHVLDVDESSYNENIFMSCSSEAVYTYSKCKAVPQAPFCHPTTAPANLCLRLIPIFRFQALLAAVLISETARHSSSLKYIPIQISGRNESSISKPVKRNTERCTTFLRLYK